MASDHRFATGPGAYSDVPPYEAIITQQLFTTVSRRDSSNNHSSTGFLDLFRQEHSSDHEERSFSGSGRHDLEVHHEGHITEQTPLKYTHNLRNPLTASVSQSHSVLPGGINNNDNTDLISFYGEQIAEGHRGSLATLKKITSQNTIKYVMSTGELPDIDTSTLEEFKILEAYSFPLVITFLLQYSLNVASVFSVGKIGKVELAAVSLAGMTANITGYCLFQGTSTSLDTLCAQAYGRRDYNQVGLHFLKCTLFLLLLFIPTAIIWIWFSGPILSYLVNDPTLVNLASQYLSVLSLGLPGFILFETLKKFLQAQNIFQASTYVIVFAAPFNAFLNYYLVWGEKFKLGFIGAPIAIVCTNYIMAFLLLAYTIYVDGYQCWCGFSKDALKNWGKMVKLSINGCIGVLSEWLAFEILTLSAARFGTIELAAQSVIATIGVLFYQIPFAISIATSTRIANLIGAASKKSVIIATRAAIILSLIVGIMNGGFLTIFKYSIIKLFTADEQVIEIASKIIPLGAAYQINDCVAAITGGILRGQGRQHIAAYISLFSYYLIALPIGFILAFGFELELFGLWIGLTIAIFSISVIQAWSVCRSNWDEIINESLQDALNESNLQVGNVNLDSEVRSIFSGAFSGAFSEAV